MLLGAALGVLEWPHGVAHDAQVVLPRDLARGPDNSERHDDFEILVLTQSKRRLEALRQVAGRVVPNDRHSDYYLATFEALTTVATATWWDLDGETYAGVPYDK